MRVLFLILFVAVPLIAQAGVFPSNGDYYVSYTDVKLADKGHDLEITRTYNSKSADIGWFGFGWGSSFETHLTVMPDETVVIGENGAGANSFFHDESKERDEKLVAAGVAKIVEAATIQDKLTPEAAAALSRKLMGSEEERFSAVKKYAVHSELHGHSKLTAFGSGYCAGTLWRTSGGYTRDDGCDKVEYFDLRGNLIRRVYKDGYQVTFRIKNDRPVEIRGSDAQRISLGWTQDGRVNRLVASNGEVVEYEYDDNHNLILSNYVAGKNAYMFVRHDYDRNHNMTRIRYLDDSSMIMTYNAGGYVTSVTERTGERTLYEYMTEAGDPNKSSTRIRKIAKNGTETVQTVGFQNSNSETGERHLQAYSIGDQGESISTELDEKHRVKRRTLSSGKFIAYTYHPTLDKVASVNLNDEVTAHYEYNSAGDLVHGDTSDGLAFKLEYDAQHMISHIITTGRDGSSSDLRIKYNHKGKPVEIKQADAGTVKVEYDSDGEISKVESDGGQALLLSIRNNYNVVIQIVKLAMN